MKGATEMPNLPMTMISTKVSTTTLARLPRKPLKVGLRPCFRQKLDGQPGQFAGQPDADDQDDDGADDLKAVLDQEGHHHVIGLLQGINFLGHGCLLRLVAWPDEVCVACASPNQLFFL